VRRVAEPARRATGLFEVITERGWSLRQAARELGLAHQTLMLWRDGEVTPSEPLREQVCLKLGGVYAKAEDYLFPRTQPRERVPA
jgi:hypothetical protein